MEQLNSDVIPLTKYTELTSKERVRYLHVFVTDRTNLSVDFCQNALGWETYPMAKWYLIRALGILKAESSIPLLLQICAEPNKEFDYTSLHTICAWSLGQIGECAITPLIDILETTVEKESIRCIVDALGEIGHPEALSSLYEAFKKGPYEIKLWAALSLSKIGKSALETLYVILEESNDWREKILVLDAIVRINDQSSIPIIKKHLYNGTLEEKQFILEHCRSFFDDSFQEVLEIIVHNEPLNISSLAKDILKNLQMSN